jgi:RNA polymerase sigma-70 factor (ECF subfamily)
MVRRERGFLQAADIEDLVQDVLVSLHAVRATYDPARPFLPWLMAILRNRLADGARRYARTKVKETALDDWTETFEAAVANMEQEAFGDPAALKAAIASLPESQRRALELVKLKELSLKEAAAESGMSVAALKVAVHRAIKALRGRLKREA